MSSVNKAKCTETNNLGVVDCKQSFDNNKQSEIVYFLYNIDTNENTRVSYRIITLQDVKGQGVKFFSLFKTHDIV